MHDLVTRLRLRIDELTDQRDDARDELERARARATRHSRKLYEQRQRAESWKARALGRRR